MKNESLEAVQIARIQDFLKQGETVWQSPSFPDGHRPETDILSARLKIASFESITRYMIHPGMRPHIDRIVVSTAAKTSNRGDRDKVAYLDLHTRIMTIKPNALNFPEPVLRRIVFHEAGTDNCDRLRIIKPDEYSQSQRRDVEAILLDAFSPRKKITIERTTIEKMGFREVVMVDGMAVSDIFHDFMDRDEIYPTIFEIVTDHILRNGGDINSFDNQVKGGSVRLSEHEDHPNFARALFRIIQKCDWRDLLSALIIGDKQKTQIYLEAKYPKTDVIYWLKLLLSFMSKDEKKVALINTLFS